MKVSLSVGDVIDRITILKIKKLRIRDPENLANVKRELGILLSECDSAGIEWPVELANQLETVNEKLWDVEHHLRVHENKADFGDEFFQRARSVCRLNDQ